MLEGIRVIEIEGLGPGPFAAMHLADLGADVVVIHRKGGNGFITSSQSIIDRGKRSIELDLKHPEDLEIARELIQGADALIEGFRPGVMERLGLGPEAMHTLNPKLVYGRMTGWGQTGPRAQQAGHDLNYIASSGALWYASLSGEAPLTPPTLVGDIGGGANYLVIGILAGIINARATGKGTVVDAAIVDGSAHAMNLLMAITQAGQMTEERGQSLLDGPHWCRAYACADGKYLSVQCLEPKFYQDFLNCLSLTDDARFAEQYDKSQWPNQTEILKDLFAKHFSAHWAELFEGTDACVAVVKSPSEAAREPHIADRNIWQTDNGHLQAAPAPRFDGVVQQTKTAPTKDQHRLAILKELGRA